MSTAVPDGPEVPGGFQAEAILARSPTRVVVRARRAGEAPVVVKMNVPGSGRGERARLRREARRLDAAAGPGLVPILDVVEGRGVTALVLALAPGGTLARRPAVDPAGLATDLRAACVRLAALGLAHRALTGDHVALTASGTGFLVGGGHLHPGPPPPDTTLDRLLTPR